MLGVCTWYVSARRMPFLTVGRQARWFGGLKNNKSVQFVLTFPGVLFKCSLWPVVFKLPLERRALTFLLYRLTEWSTTLILHCMTCTGFLARRQSVSTSKAVQIPAYSSFLSNIRRSGLSVLLLQTLIITVTPATSQLQHQGSAEDQEAGCMSHSQTCLSIVYISCQSSIFVLKTKSPLLLDILYSCNHFLAAPYWLWLSFSWHVVHR